jgi:hypothetical protein
MRWDSLLTCDDCGRKFKVKLEIVELENGGEKHFFSCPGCKRGYHVATISPKGVEIRRQLEKLSQSQVKRRGLARKIRRLRKQLKPEVI